MSVLLPLDPYIKVKQTQQLQKKTRDSVKRNRAYCSPWIIKSTRLSSSKDKSNSFTASFKTICLIGCRYDVIRRIAFEKGYVEVSEKDVWNIMWTDTPISLDKALEMRRFQDAHSIFWGASPPVQKANHFPGMTEICRKDRLARNLNRMKQSFHKDYDFFPRTWSLPTDLTELLMYSKAKRNATYICKPDTGCQGKGIFLVRNLKMLNPFIKLICQVYISRPFLIDGYKFDLRIYSLITSCEPLRIYVYNEGIARFATVKYEHPSDTNLDSVYMHLTNYSLNKFSQSYVPDGEGSKRKMTSVFNWLMDNGYNVPKLVNQIDSIIVKTMIAAQPTLRHFYRASFPKYERGSACFELLGFDIIVDRSLHPFLLEVNHSPSFNLDLPVDEEIKEALLRDTFAAIFLDFSKGSKDSEEQGRGHHDSSAASGNRLSLALQNQFSHEASHKGNFRLVYPGEDHSKYQRFLDQTMGPSWRMETSSTINGNRVIPPYQQSFHAPEPPPQPLQPHTAQDEIIITRSKFGPPLNSSPAVNHRGKGIGSYKFKFTENEHADAKNDNSGSQEIPTLHQAKSTRTAHGSQAQAEIRKTDKSGSLEEKEDIISNILANAKENNNTHGFHGKSGGVNGSSAGGSKSKIKNPYKHQKNQQVESDSDHAAQSEESRANAKLKRGKSTVKGLAEVVVGPTKTPTIAASIRKNIAEKLSQIRSQYSVKEWYVSSRLDLMTEKNENERGESLKESVSVKKEPKESLGKDKVGQKKMSKSSWKGKPLRTIRSRNVCEIPRDVKVEVEEEEEAPVVNPTEEEPCVPIQEREELERSKLLLSREKFLRNMVIEEEVHKILQRTKKSKKEIEAKEFDLNESPHETRSVGT